MTPPKSREMIADALTTRLSAFSTSGREITRQEFENLLSGWVEEIDPALTLNKKSVAAQLRTNLCSWVRDSTFYVPGLGIRLSIAKAFIQLKAMRDDKSVIGTKTQLDEQLNNYLEFGERLRRTDNSSSVTSGTLPLTRKHVVLVGGPGAGKSTTLKHFAWQLSGEGMIVLYVRLPLLAQLIRDGASLEDAIMQTAFDGSGIDIADRKRLLESADALLCDGLDECAPNCPLISQRLMQWSIGHADCAVYVATRPVGHDTAFLPNFDHYGLMPPDENQIRELAGTLFKDCLSGEYPEVECARFLA